MQDRVIVLVEDNANDEELTLRAFRNRKIEDRVVVLRDGAEALDDCFCRGAHATRFVEAVRRLGLYWRVINLAAPA